MSRLPFDPSKMAAARAAANKETATGTTSDQPITVSQLASKIDLSLKTGLPGSIRVTGEVSGFRDRTHWYFDLKDAESVVNCVVFASAAKNAGFTPANGQAVIAKGAVEFYAKGGKVTLLVTRLEPAGEGALELALRKLCEELRGLGWFAPERKRPLPTFPRRVAVITSKTGAALQDVLVTMKRRCPGVGVLLIDARVQGENAAPEVAAAIRYVSTNARKLGVDAVLVTRGGGSMEDLWAFNERTVAEAIVKCSIPVVAAIGHETDTTIAELVADERCATPTQAAMRLTPDREALLREVASTQSRLHFVLGRRVRLEQVDRTNDARHLMATVRSRLLEERSRLDRALGGIDRSHPRAVYAQLLERIELAQARMRSAMDRRLVEAGPTPLLSSLRREAIQHTSRSRDRLAAAEKQLRGVGPLRVLERGYSVTLRADGRAVRAPHEVRDGDLIETRLAEGSIRSVVGEGVIPLPASRPAIPKPADPVRPESPVRNPQRSRTKDPESTPGLFG
jgi:exodeoxyribonuclease VII large subunit